MISAAVFSEELLLEVKTSGMSIEWYHDGLPISGTRGTLLHWDEVYFVENSTMQDLGNYQVGVSGGSNEMRFTSFRVVLPGTYIIINNYTYIPISKMHIIIIYKLH